MTLSFNSADASFYYYEQAAADFAMMDSSAVCGNLADAMKDSVVLLPADIQAATLLILENGDDESGGEEQDWASSVSPT